MSLQKIVSSVRLICEAIASVVNIDVTIVDDRRVRLAGTGRYRESVGEVVSVNSAFSYALSEGHGFIIENPGEHQACVNCDCKDKCNEHAEVCCPILIGGQTVGVIGLIAFEDAQRKALIENKENLMSFLERMADLIATKLKEFESHEVLELLAKELEVVVDSLDTSLVAVDIKGDILRVNRRFAKTFTNDALKFSSKSSSKSSSTEIKHISDFIGLSEWQAIQTARENSKNHFHTFAGGIQGVYDVSLIKVGQAVKGYIITIKSIEEVMNTISDVMADSPVTGFDHIVGHSESLLQAKALAKKVAGSDSTVLILGESGTGKELFARAIHHSSPRSGAPFVAINCAAIPDHLLESELFGYDEGAFTGARRGGKPGKFQLANKGTLFLDEIGDMPLHLQAKLLRVLQEKRVDRLGSEQSSKVDVRLIAATHRNLEEKVIEGSFRQDLYYRLNVIPIIVPPLRERPDDVLITARVMVAKWCGKLHKEVPELSRAFVSALQSHDWPGNVRELENAIEYAVNLCDDFRLEPHHLPKRLTSTSGDAVQNISPAQSIRPIEQLEREAIKAAIGVFGDSGEGLKHAAEALGISLATLYRKLKHFKI